MQNVETASQETVEFHGSPDTLFGVCQAIGQDFGFNPLFLRLGMLGLGFFSLPATLATYAALGVAVAASRWLFPAAANPSVEAPALLPVPLRKEQDLIEAREPELVAA